MLPCPRTWPSTIADFVFFVQLAFLCFSEVTMGLNSQCLSRKGLGITALYFPARSQTNSDQSTDGNRLQYNLYFTFKTNSCTNWQGFALHKTIFHVVLLYLTAQYQSVLHKALYNNNNNCFTALCPWLPRWAGTRRNIHPPTFLIIIQSLSASSIYYDP